MRKLIFIIITAILCCLFPKEVGAEELNQYVTVVNPVRILPNNNNPKESLRSEYQEIQKRNLPATWLLTYDVLDNDSMVSIVRGFNAKQEIGLFLEVSDNFAKKTGVIYNDTGFWHHANSVFLSGYTQEERIKLIDNVFEKFKDNFGYYPKSVGSWWTDSFSLSYMKDKYGITANLGCSDQYSTDGYRIWGQYWSTPYYPSRYHAGIPASDESVKLDLVTIQWAPRDPLNGYRSSFYSTQDYPVAGKGLTIDFFEKLISLFALVHQNEFGQITLGLEADLGPDIYIQEYAKQLDVVSKLSKNSTARIVTMSVFSDWYRGKFPKLSPPQIIEAEDFLGTKTKVVWYQSPKYRISYETDENGQITIRDLRLYNSQLQEPYYLSPNRQFNLTININPILDEIDFDQKKVILPKRSEIITEPDKLRVKASDYSLSKLFRPINLPFKYDIKDGYYEFTFSDNNENREGTIIKGYSSEAIHFFKQKKMLFNLLIGKGWNYFTQVNYLIPQEELVALRFLSNLTDGKVLVYDQECLQCEYHTQYKPPVFANLRKYVQIYGKHKIVSNSKVFKAGTREESKKEFEKLKVRYIYLVKFEGYKEELPFSPGDLGVERIFENANVVIWMVK